MKVIYLISRVFLAWTFLKFSGLLAVCSCTTKDDQDRDFYDHWIYNNNTFHGEIEIDSDKKEPAWQETCTMARVRYFPKGPIYSVCPHGIIRIQEVAEFLNR